MTMVLPAVFTLRKAPGPNATYRAARPRRANPRIVHETDEGDEVALTSDGGCASKKTRYVSPSIAVLFSASTGPRVSNVTLSSMPSTTANLRARRSRYSGNVGCGSEASLVNDFSVPLSTG